MSMLMLKENATVTITHSITKDLKEVTKTNEGYTIYSFNDKNDMDKWLKIFPSYIKEYDLKTDMINMNLTSKED